MTAFLDTNVLLYAVSELESESTKRDRARAVIDCQSCVLSMQVLQEFVYQATHPRRESRKSLDEAIAQLESWRRFPVQETTRALFDHGLRLHERDRFSFWDSMIVAAAIAQGCAILYSEDMPDGRIIDRLRIENPFR